MTAQTRMVKANGLDMQIIEEGKGPLVLLCHGWPELSYSWRHQIPAIAAAGYRVVAPDWHTLDEPARLADTDAWLAQELNTLRHRLSTRAFSPLPLLGIPGLTPANESADYYADSRQFRPRRQR